MSAAPLHALFINEGDSSGTIGQGRFAAAVRDQTRSRSDIEASFATLLPPYGWNLRASSALRARLWNWDLDFQSSRWHAVQALRVRAMASRVLTPEIEVLHVHPLTAALLLDRDLLARTAVSLDAEIWDWRSMGIWQTVRPWSRLQVAPSLWLQRRALEAAGTVVAWSDWAKRGVEREVPRAAVTALHPGIDTAAFSPGPRSAREVARFLFVGVRFARKGGFDLIDALRTLLDDGRAELDIVTRDEVPERPGIRVHRLSPGSAELLALFQQADCFCLPSYGDAAAWVVLEAMACGTPVIASDVGAIPEFLDGGRAGMLVTPGDGRALREAVTRIADDPACGAEFAAVSRQRIERHYDLTINTARLIELMTALRPVDSPTGT
jgi:glycosyltransferase involved in cell wall biosynthesis